MITEALTKGLDPNVEIKNSGIEWIGKIPKDWELRGIGRYIHFSGGSQPDKTFFIDHEEDGYVRLIQNRDYRTDEYPTYVPRNTVSKFCDKSDVMVGRYGPPIFVMHRGLSGAYNVALIKCTPIGIDKEWMSFVLQEKHLIEYVESYSKRSCGQNGVDPIILKTFKMPLPPIETQKKIARYLEEKSKDIELLLKYKQKQIESLLAYKKSLIYEYVTGKKEVC